MLYAAQFKGAVLPESDDSVSRVSFGKGYPGIVARAEVK
jgi:hypothetical protein